MNYRIQYAASGAVVEIQWPPEALSAALGELMFTFSTLERTLREIPSFEDWHTVVSISPPTTPLRSVIRSLRQIETRGDSTFGEMLDRADALNQARNRIVHGYAWPSRVPGTVVLQDDLQQPIDVHWIDDLRDQAFKLRQELLAWLVAQHV